MRQNLAELVVNKGAESTLNAAASTPRSYIKFEQHIEQQDARV
jgi:hypothetical protein